VSLRNVLDPEYSPVYRSRDLDRAGGPQGVMCQNCGRRIEPGTEHHGVARPYVCHVKDKLTQRGLYVASQAGGKE